MKRIVIKLVLFLLLGALVNVAVAWGCALWAPTRAYENFTMFEGEAKPMSAVSHANWSKHRPKEWPELRVRNWPEDMVHTTEVFEIGLGRYDSIAVAYGPESGAMRVMTTHVSGWPLPALRAIALYNDAFNVAPVRLPPLVQPDRIVYGIAVRTQQDVERAPVLPDAGVVRVLPLRPVSWGFIANTAIYGVLLWAACCAVSSGRGAIRTYRGRCSKCGYDLRHAGHELCPECGAQR